MKERRRHVRTKPDPSLPAVAVRRIDALLKESLEVLDISPGGMALAMRDVPLGTRMDIALTLGSAEALPLEVEVRWAGEGSVGVSFVDPPAATSNAVQKYVAELLERGGAV
jgi:hypothetical protein